MSFCFLRRFFFSSSFSLGRLRLDLRVDLALEHVDVALHAHHGVDGVLDLVDQAALHRLGELDAADRARHVDAGAQRLHARAAVLLLVLLQDDVQLLGELDVVAARLADFLDLPEDVDLAILDHLVGDLLVAEDHELADGALAGAQLIADHEDALGNGRRAGDRLDDRELAALDALGDGDLALAGEQRHRAHLAEVHADGVVGLVERARREIELGAFLGAVAIEVLVAAVRLVGIDDLDARAAERVEELVEIFRGGDLRRQHLVDLVVEQVALFLADLNQLAYFVVFFFNRQGCSSATRSK